MICLLASRYSEAERFAKAQLLDQSEWFFGMDEDELKKRTSFHVITIGYMDDVPQSFFNRIYDLAKKRGRLGRS